MKIKIKVEEEVENCLQCPYSFYYSEHGFYGHICSKTDHIVSGKEIHKDCPFLKNA